MSHKLWTFAAVAACTILLLAGCGRPVENSQQTAPPTSLSQVPAVRLNFRYEADVPGPSQSAGASVDRIAAVQADFDQSRPQDILDRTLTSPDNTVIAAVFHRVGDVASEYRIDLYSTDGRLLRKVTAETMAVHFPDTVVWSPDSSTLAFTAMLRAKPEGGTVEPAENESGMMIPAEPAADPGINANVETAESPSPEPPANVLTFRTEQIYLVNKDGSGLKPITQSEGKIFFYFTWSPDSAMLLSLVATLPEWKAMHLQSETRGEAFVPAGRPRVVEKNGRQRLLDDALTQVRPVWSPDSTKTAVAFDTQIRIYDALGNTPTQAAIPLRNQLLISSQAYDQQLQRNETDANVSGRPNTQPVQAAGHGSSTLPDPATLASFGPIVELIWTSDELLYFQTGYVKEYKDPANNRRSFMRWHRLVLTPQPVVNR